MGKFVETGSSKKRGGRWKEELLLDEYKVSVWEDEKKLWKKIVVMVAMV